MALSLLSLFLLSEKGINYFTLGETIRNIKASQELAFQIKKWYIPLSKFLCLLPKQFIHQTINDNFIKQDYNNKKIKISYLKYLKHIMSYDSYSEELYYSIFEDFRLFISEVLEKETFFR